VQLIWQSRGFLSVQPLHEAVAIPGTRLPVTPFVKAVYPAFLLPKLRDESGTI